MTVLLILNPNLRKIHEDDKLGILDVRVLMNNDTEIDTEIQLSELKAWADRSLFYAAKMEFHVIELPKLPKELKDNCSLVELWAKFINAEETEEFDMIATKDPYIKSAYDQLQVISQDRQKRMEYEAREKAILDHNQLIYEAELRGEQRVNQLNLRLIQDKRYDDIERSASDPLFQRQLISEYGI